MGKHQKQARDWFRGLGYGEQIELVDKYYPNGIVGSLNEYSLKIYLAEFPKLQYCKALSIKQPWASLIAHGIKTIENRTWPTKFRGRIYIHASAKAVSSFDFTEQQTLALSTVDTDNIVFTNSAIIGEVDIIDCVVNHESIWAEKTPIVGKTLEGEPLIKTKPVYNLVLANAVLYENPILNVKGKLSFWEFQK